MISDGPAGGFIFLFDFRGPAKKRFFYFFCRSRFVDFAHFIYSPGKVDCGGTSISDIFTSLVEGFLEISFLLAILIGQAHAVSGGHTESRRAANGQTRNGRGHFFIAGAIDIGYCHRQRCLIQKGKRMACPLNRFQAFAHT